MSAIGAQPSTKNAAILSISELQRIKESCTLNQQRDFEDRQKVKQELFQKSQARVKNWPNTIKATREKKEKDRIKKLEEEEIERRKIDAMEEALQNDLRNEAVKRANVKLYEAQDRVKAFHSKMLMCDVLAERDQQVKLQKKKKQIMDGIDKQWVDYEKQQIEEQDLSLIHI